MEQLRDPSVVVDEREESPRDADVAAHAGVLRVLRVHVVALLVGDHLERQLVVVAQEDAPLAVVGDRRRAVEDLDDRRGVLAPQRHEHPRHEREVEGHVALVPVLEVLHDVLGPLVGLREQDLVRVLLVDRLAQALEVLVGLREVLAVRAVTLNQVGDRDKAQAVDAHVEPVAHGLDDRL